MSKCLICDTENFPGGWTDLNGEASCLICGTPYQIVNGTLLVGEVYPRCNIDSAWLPCLRAYWQETRKPNWQGIFLGWRSQKQRIEAEDFADWVHVHKELLPSKVGEKK